jgi:hypothetical protein
VALAVARVAGLSLDAMLGGKLTDASAGESARRASVVVNMATTRQRSGDRARV